MAGTTIRGAPHLRHSSLRNPLSSHVRADGLEGFDRHRIDVGVTFGNRQTLGEDRNRDRARPEPADGLYKAPEEISPAHIDRVKRPGIRHPKADSQARYDS